MSNFEFVSASGLVQLSHFHPVARATGSSYVGLRPARHFRPEADTNPCRGRQATDAHPNTKAGGRHNHRTQSTNSSPPSNTERFEANYDGGNHQGPRLSDE